MPSKVERFYWDACVFLSGIDKIPDRIAAIEHFLFEAEAGRIEIYTSTLSITEVAFAKVEKTKAILEPELDQKIDQLWSASSPVKLVEFHELIAFDAKSLIRDAVPHGWSLKPADAIHLATARGLGVTAFHTYDGPLKKYEAFLPFKIDTPHADILPFQDPIT